jgi:hypothetical protein
MRLGVLSRAQVPSTVVKPGELRSAAGSKIDHTILTCIKERDSSPSSFGPSDAFPATLLHLLPARKPDEALHEFYKKWMKLAVSRFFSGSAF